MHPAARLVANIPAQLNLDLKRVLGTNRWQVTLIAHGPSRQTFATSISIPLLAHEGFVAKLAPAP